MYIYRNPGHLNPRSVSSAMSNKMFHGSQQQDAQEFIRSLLNQLHDELNVTVPVQLDQLQSTTDKDLLTSKKLGSRLSILSQESCSSSGSLTKLMDHNLKQAPQHHSSSGLLAASPSVPSKKNSSFPFSPMKKCSSNKLAKGTYMHLSESQLKGKERGSQGNECSDKNGDENEESDADEDSATIKWSKNEVFLVDVPKKSVSVHQISSPACSLEDDDNAREMDSGDLLKDGTLSKTFPENNHSVSIPELKIVETQTAVSSIALQSKKNFPSPTLVNTSFLQIKKQQLGKYRVVGNFHEV